MFSLPGRNNHAQAGQVVQIVVYGLERNAGFFVKIFRTLRALVQPGEELNPSVSEKKQEGEARWA